MLLSFEGRFIFAMVSTRETRFEMRSRFFCLFVAYTGSCMRLAEKEKTK